jgi:hypothetical protein
VPVTRGETFPCPNCGADVPPRARVCPECGSDDETGWSEDTLYDGLDLPDPGYGPDPGPPPPRRHIGRIVAVVMLALIAIWLISRAW